MEAYFINPRPSKFTMKAIARHRKQIRKRRRKASVKKTEPKKEIKTMAQSRKQRAATMRNLKKAQAARKASKFGGKTRKARKAHRKARRAPRRKAAKTYRRKSHRRRHIVKAHHVTGYNRKRHWSNPFMRIGDTGSAVVGGLVAVGVLFGSLFAVGYLNGAKNRIPMLASGWGSLAAKLAIGLGVGMAAAWASRKNWVSGKNAAVIGAAGFAPLGLDLLSRVAPGIAGQISLADEMDAEMGAGLGMTPGNRLSDNTIDAEMGAEMGAEGESEMSSY